MTPAKQLQRQDQLRYCAHNLTLKKVEEFDFTFKDYDFLGGTQKLRALRKVEGILINPVWARHQFDPSTQDVVPVEGSQGMTMAEFSKLKISEQVLRDGIIFCWVEKELIHPVIRVFEKQQFEYIENLCHVMLNPAQKETTKLMGNTDATPAISREPYPYLNKSHRTLLMLRRNIRDERSEEAPLELRH